MASSMRSERAKGETSGPSRVNPQQPVLNVTPISCVPYNGPPSPDDMLSSPNKENTEPAETVGPAMIFLPPQSTQEELDNMMAATRFGVAVTGVAATAAVGPAVGQVDMAEVDDGAYYFRVTLPGVSQAEGDFSFNIEPDGTVLIKGISTTGEKVIYRDFQIFHMQTQNLCRPGDFTVSFQLPGPVNPQEVTSLFADGMFEAIVKKN